MLPESATIDRTKKLYIVNFTMQTLHTSQKTVILLAVNVILRIAIASKTIVFD